MLSLWTRWSLSTGFTNTRYLGVIEKRLSQEKNQSKEFCKAASLQLEEKLHETIMDARQAISQLRKGSDTALNLQEISTTILTAIAPPGPPHLHHRLPSLPPV